MASGKHPDPDRHPVSACAYRLLIAGGLLAATPGWLAALELGTIDIHGFISQGFLKSSDNNWGAETADGTFEFNEAALNISTDLTDQLRGGMQFFARDLGSQGNNAVVIDWAYLDYRRRREFGLRAGRVKYAAGLYNEYQDVDAARPTIILPQSVYYTLEFRETSVAINGLQLYGNIPLGDGGGDFDYQLTAGSPSFTSDDSVSRAIAVRFDEFNGADADYGLQSALYWNTPLEGLRLGIATVNLLDLEADGRVAVDPAIPLTFETDFVIENYASWIASVEYSWQDLTLTAEYRGLDWNQDITVHDAIVGVDPGSGAPIYADISTHETRSETGWYLQASYDFARDFTASVYYAHYRADRDDDILEDHRRDMTDIAASLRWDINQHWNTKIEAHWIDGTALLRDYNNDDFEDEWWLVALKTTLSF